MPDDGEQQSTECKHPKRSRIDLPAKQAWCRRCGSFRSAWGTWLAPIDRPFDVASVKPRTPSQSAWTLAERIAHERGLDLLQLRAADRRKFAVETRQNFALLLRDAGLSYPEIGAVLARDHTTIMSSVSKAKARAERRRSA
jgi:DNA-directed RNA polymerase specialized sigma24 family protein